MRKRYHLDFALLGSFIMHHRKQIRKSRKEFVTYLKDRGYYISYSMIVRIEDGDMTAIKNNLDLLNRFLRKKITLDERPYEKVRDISETFYHALCLDERNKKTNELIVEIKDMYKKYANYLFIGDLLELYITVFDYCTKSLTENRRVYDLFLKVLPKLHEYDALIAKYYLYSFNRRLPKKDKDLLYFGKELIDHSFFLLDASSYLCRAYDPLKMIELFKDPSYLNFKECPKLSKYAALSCLSLAYFNLNRFCDAYKCLESSLKIPEILELLPIPEANYAKMRFGIVAYYLENYQICFDNLFAVFKKDPNYLFANVALMCKAGEKVNKTSAVKACLEKCKLDDIKRPCERYLITYFKMKYSDTDQNMLEKYLLSNFDSELALSNIYIEIIKEELQNLIKSTKHYKRYFDFTKKLGL